MMPSQIDDIGSGIERLEDAIAQFAETPSDDNRNELLVEARSLLGTFVDESLYGKKVDGRHEAVKTLFTRSLNLMAANPDDLSVQMGGYVAEIMDFSPQRIKELLQSA